VTTHLLTFDIEEWFHLVGVRAMDDRSRWESLEPTVEPLTDAILTLLAQYQAKATFFVLGWVAQRYPRLVQRIAGEGHELASHSYWHYELYKHSPVSLRKDLEQSIDVIRQAAGVPVRGFRAPSFSLTPGCEWAWDVMLDLGLTYDASVFPIARAHGGYPLACEAGPGAFVKVPAPSGRDIRVLPMSVMRLPVLGRSLAFSGGGYFRVWPWRLIERGFAEHEASGRPAVLYLHPWDFAPGGPALPMRAHQRFKCYYGRAKTEPRLRALLERYRFGPCAEQLG